MAGSGKKTFTAGDVLTASDVNNYLMDQTVMVFGGTAARASAIPTPSEGMFAVTTDNDELDYYDGTNWVPALPVGSWQSWAPTLSGGWLNGNGTYDAKYCQIGKTVHWRVTFTVGSTTTKGSGMVMSLPVTAAATNSAVSAQGFLVTGSTRYIASVLFGNTTTVTIGTSVANATYTTWNAMTATTPFTWATNDIVILAGTYEAA
jgi:hypothetical protein